MLKLILAVVLLGSSIVAHADDENPNQPKFKTKKYSQNALDKSSTGVELYPSIIDYFRKTQEEKIGAIYPKHLELARPAADHQDYCQKKYEENAVVAILKYRNERGRLFAAAFLVCRNFDNSASQIEGLLDDPISVAEAEWNIGQYEKTMNEKNYNFFDDCNTVAEPEQLVCLRDDDASSSILTWQITPVGVSSGSRFISSDFWSDNPTKCIKVKFHVQSRGHGGTPFCQENPTYVYHVDFKTVSSAGEIQVQQSQP